MDDVYTDEETEFSERINVRKIQKEKSLPWVR
jgi:hypothetical protein